MKKLLSGFVFGVILLVVSTNAQVAPSIDWAKCLGGSGIDEASSILQTFDNGFISVGGSESTDGDVSGNQGIWDYWIVKLDSSGNLLWQKSIGGSGFECALSIYQTSDSGFIVAGYSGSIDGDVSGCHGYTDYWITKLNSAGNLIWQNCFGGLGEDFGRSLQQTIDGGFIVAGSSQSNSEDVSGNHGGLDYWIIKLDTVGDMVWEKCFGGTNEDRPNSIQQTIDGGFIISGYSNSNNGDVSGWHYGVNAWGDTTTDYWIVKLNTMGDLMWQKCLGGSGDDGAYSIQQTTDGGFVAAGYSESNDGDVLDNHGYTDYWIVKLDSLGNLMWQKCLGDLKLKVHIPFNKLLMVVLLLPELLIPMILTFQEIMAVETIGLLN